jgi:NADH-quinone oxidoreductase subunit L
MNAPFSVSLELSILDALLSLVGIGLAYVLYRKPEEAKLEGWNALLFFAFYLDEAYRHVFVRPYRWISAVLWQRVDESGIDKTIESFGISFDAASMALRLITTGRLSSYLKALLVGLVGLLCLFVGSSTLW